MTDELAIFPVALITLYELPNVQASVSNIEIFGTSLITHPQNES